MKERITLTIGKSLLEKIDKSIDGICIKNRSHAVELLLMKALGADVPKKALILAGGKGTRMKPITEEIPKPMIPLMGQPLIQHTIDLLKKYNIIDVIISVGYKAEQIKEYFGNGSKFGIKITYIEEDKPLGTAGPLKLAEQLLTSTFILCNADELKEIDLADMFRFHKKNQGIGTVALTTAKNPESYGVARLQGNRILEFIEKPKEPPSNLINSGLYILEPEVTRYVPDGFSMIEKDVFPKIARAGKLYGYHFSGYWKDLGTIETYRQAIEELRSRS